MPKTQKTYLVLWTYIANFNEKPWRFQANSPEEAIEKLFRVYNGQDFREKARVYVMEEIAATHNVDGETDYTFVQDRR